MIDGKSGQRKIKTLVKSVDEASRQYLDANWEILGCHTLALAASGLMSSLCPQRYIDEVTRTYTWTPVGGTDYR